MNKILTVALIAGGLLLLDSPEAAAHKEVRNVYQPSAYYRVEHRRAKQMPYWLKRNRSFRDWYKRTHTRRYRHLAWHQLFDVYLWERHYRKSHRHSDYYKNYYRRYDNYRDYDNYRGHGKQSRHDDRKRRHRKH